MDFSAVLVTFNDEAHLEECLEHLAFCAERVVVDLGSTDSSVAIAERLGARVVRHEWVPIADQIRAFMVEQTVHDWIVYMDPDQIFPDHLMPQIENAIKANDGLALIAIPRRDYFRGKLLRTTRWSVIDNFPAVMHRRRMEDFTPLVHGSMYPRPGWQSLQFETGVEADVIKHYWNDSYAQFLEKHRRYIRLEGEARFKRGNRFSWRKAIGVTCQQTFYCLIQKRGILGGIDGIALSALWGWYTWSAWQSLRTYQQGHSNETQEQAGPKENQQAGKRSLIRGARRRAAVWLHKFADKMRPPARGKDLSGETEIATAWEIFQLQNQYDSCLVVGQEPDPQIIFAAVQRATTVQGIFANGFGPPIKASSLSINFAIGKLWEIEEKSIDVCLCLGAFGSISFERLAAGNKDDPRIDITIMQHLRGVLRPGGRLVVTMPVGRDGVHRQTRVYGMVRIGHLLTGWKCEAEQYWSKQVGNAWEMVPKQTAFEEPGSPQYHALGCFVLAKEGK